MRRVRLLIVPYCFFEIMGVVWRMVFFNQPFTTGLYNLFTIRCNVGADWFLPAMFLGNLLFWLYVKWQNYLYGILSTVVSFLLPMVMNGNQLLIVVGRGLLAYAFMMSGSMLKPMFLSEKTKSAVWIISSFVATAVVTVVGLKYGGNDFYSCTVQNPLALWVGGLSGTVLIIGFSRIFQCKIFSNYIGHHTLSIMGTHQLVIYIMTTFIPATMVGTFVYGLLLMFAIIIFEIPIVWLIDYRFGVFTEK